MVGRCRTAVEGMGKTEEGKDAQASALLQGLQQEPKLDWLMFRCLDLNMAQGEPSG